MKRYLAFLMFTILLLVGLTIPALADEPIQEIDMLEQEKQLIEAVILDFMDRYTGNMYLYESNELLTNTSAQLTEVERANLSASTGEFALTSQVNAHQNLTQITDSMDYVVDKAAYWKFVRQTQNLNRTDFQTAYTFDTIRISGSYAQVALTEHIAFYYEGATIQSCMTRKHEIFLYHHKTGWLIFDITSDDGFDGTHKFGEFDAEAEMLAFEQGYVASESTTIATGQISSSEGEQTEIQALTASTRTYNRQNAVNYAYTYTKQGVEDAFAYYNDNFNKYRIRAGYSSDADCVNFVSQCIFAGFMGSNDATSIASLSLPQDNYGSCAEAKWYAHGSSWINTHSFYAYVTYIDENSENEESEEKVDLTRMIATVVEIPANTSTITSPSNLTGAAALVDGDTGNFGHAIIITEQQGSNRNQLYYCGHTSDDKYIILGDVWSVCPIRIILPTSMNYGRACLGTTHSYTTVAAANGMDATCNSCGYCRLYVTNTLSPPVPVGTTKTLVGGIAGMSRCYRATMKVVTPNGNVVWLDEVLNSGTYSQTYTFSERGLYTITLYARDLNPDVYPDDSVQRYHTYTIRCY